MDEEKIVEVANKLDIEQSVIKGAKRKRIWKKLVYPFIQLAINAISITLLIFSYPLLGIGSGDFLHSTYPIDLLGDLKFVLINPFNWTLQIGNLTVSYYQRDKFGVKKYHIIVVSVINFLVAELAFLGLHQLLNTSLVEQLSGTGISVEYGVFSKELSLTESTKFQ